MADKGKGKGGCRKAAMWAGLGCLALPVLGLLFAGISLGWGFLFYSHDGPHEHQSTSLSVPLAGDEAAGVGIQPGVDFEQLQSAQRRGRPPVLLNIDLQEVEVDRQRDYHEMEFIIQTVKKDKQQLYETLASRSNVIRLKIETGNF